MNSYSKLQLAGLALIVAGGLLAASAHAADDFVAEAIHATHQPGAAALATRYICDEGKTFSVNYILGASTATFDGKQWKSVEILDTKAFHEDDDQEYAATQYTFENNGTRLYFVTGKGRAATGALLLPNSDDFLYCEATK